ncbi:MAG: preprotein translocase subunit YajC [Actinomycetota bacterium]|nr:preprotein translocase subunit YajC [Actinomycetota bacterium]
MSFLPSMEIQMFFAAAATTTQSSSITTLLFPLLLVVGAYFLFIRPRSQQMKRTQMQSRDVSIGDRVMTTSGMLGRVVRLNEETVMLEIAPDVEVSFVRRAISKRMDESDPAVQEIDNPDGIPASYEDGIPASHDDEFPGTPGQAEAGESGHEEPEEGPETR